jgi:hypothetical protein
MDLMAPDIHAAQELARRLLAQEIPEPAAPDDVVAGMQRVCEGVCQNLRRWVGTDGSAALFARALDRARGDHAALKGVRAATSPGGCLEGLAASVEAHGPKPVMEGVVALLTLLVELLGRLIGSDMAINLMDQTVPDSRPRGRAQAQ